MAKRQTFSHYAAAIDRGLFGQADETPPPPSDINVEDLERTSLNLTLLGTVSGDEKTARAIIEDKTKRSQSLYKEGDTIQNAEIMRILRAKVILKVGEKNQVLTMEEKPTGSASSRVKPSRPSQSALQSEGTTTITLDAATVNKSLENITELLSQVRVRPHYKDGKADGLMLSQVKPNTIFTRLGLRNGDIIQDIDGEGIENPDDIMDFYEELRSGSSVSLGIQRRGKKKVVNYEFKK
jgi:general secretion pathway protein C